MRDGSLDVFLNQIFEGNPLNSSMIILFRSSHALTLCFWWVAQLKKCSTFAAAKGGEVKVLHIGGNSSVGRARPCQGRGREFESRLPLFDILNCLEEFLLNNAQVAELVDAHVSGACVSRRAGSSPVLGTF